MDLEEKKRRKRERARLAYHKQFEGLNAEQTETLRKKIRATGKASYLRCRVLKVKRTPEERRLRRNALAKARYTPHPRPKVLLSREELNKASAAYLKKRRDTEPEFRILHTLRARMNALLRVNTGRLPKAGRSEELCGEGFFEHIKRELKPGMELTGRRTHKWHIDHVVPCSWFDMTRAEHQRACFHWSNLQPEFAEHNLRKKDKCTPADVDRVVARCPEEFRSVFTEMRERAERESSGRNLSCNPI